MSKGFTVEELKELMTCVAQNDIGELLLEDESTKLRIRGGCCVNVGGPTATFVTTQTAPAAPVAAQTVLAQEAVAAKPAGAVIASPIVGTFYAASGPDKEAFAKVGQLVSEGDIVFIIESMKVMNEVPADKSGVIAEILVENGAAVEYGQPILRLE